MGEWFCTNFPVFVAQIHPGGRAYVDFMMSRNGGLTSLKLVTLVEQLDDTSRFAREITGNASLLEQLAAGSYNILGAANSEEDTFEPINVNREDDDDQDELERDSASTEELDAWFAGDLQLAQLISEGGGDA